MQSFHGHGMFHAALSSSNHAASLYSDKRGVANFSKGYESGVMNVVKVVQFAEGLLSRYQLCKPFKCSSWHLARLDK